MSRGRMILKTISMSERFANLSPNAALLFTLLIPHYNSFGKMQAEAYTIKGTVCPKIPYFTLELITDCLHEISQKTNVKYFQHDGLWYLHAVEWDAHQELRKDRRGKDELPNWPGLKPDTPPGQPTDFLGTMMSMGRTSRPSLTAAEIGNTTGLQNYSGSSPVQVLDRSGLEEEVQGEEEDLPPYPPQAGGEGESGLGRQGTDGSSGTESQVQLLAQKFRDMLSERRKTIFDIRWERRNTNAARFFIEQGKSVEEVLECAKWCLDEAKASATIDNLAQVLNFYNTWTGVTQAKKPAPVNKAEKIFKAIRDGETLYCFTASGYYPASDLEIVDGPVQKVIIKSLREQYPGGILAKDFTVAKPQTVVA